MALAAVSLVAALTAALIRVGWGLAPVSGPYVVQHGALMVGGFLGALISLERAVALQRRWPYVVPLLAGLGGLSLVIGLPAIVARGLLTAASLGLVLVFALIVRLRPKLDTVVMALGAASWLAGNVLWLMNTPMPQVVPWWMAFLVFTIAGERLELAAVLRLSRTASRLFAVVIAGIAIGLVVSLGWIDAGLRLAGLSFAALALWLLRYDVARYTVRRTGLPRYVAICLLLGYGWLLLGGATLFVLGQSYAYGLTYDAVLHAVLLGFVMSMIFGHAPIIFPSVLRLPLSYTPLYYLPLVLLHISLAARIAGDLLLSFELRRWGGLLNVAAVVLFLALVMLTLLMERRAKRAAR